MSKVRRIALFHGSIHALLSRALDCEDQRDLARAEPLYASAVDLISACLSLDLDDTEKEKARAHLADLRKIVTDAQWRLAVIGEHRGAVAASPSARPPRDPLVDAATANLEALKSPAAPTSPARSSLSSLLAALDDLSPKPSLPPAASAAAASATPPPLVQVGSGTSPVAPAAAPPATADAACSPISPPVDGPPPAQPPQPQGQHPSLPAPPLAAPSAMPPPPADLRRAPAHLPGTPPADAPSARGPWCSLSSPLPSCADARCAAAPTSHTGADPSAEVGGEAFASGLAGAAATAVAVGTDARADDGPGIEGREAAGEAAAASAEDVWLSEAQGRRRWAGADGWACQVPVVAWARSQPEALAGANGCASFFSLFIYSSIRCSNWLHFSASWRRSCFSAVRVRSPSPCMPGFAAWRCCVCARGLPGAPFHFVLHARSQTVREGRGRAIRNGLALGPRLTAGALPLVLLAPFRPLLPASPPLPSPSPLPPRPQRVLEANRRLVDEQSKALAELEKGPRPAYSPICRSLHWLLSAPMRRQQEAARAGGCGVILLGRCAAWCPRSLLPGWPRAGPCGLSGPCPHTTACYSRVWPQRGGLSRQQWMAGPCPCAAPPRTICSPE